ncbi:MAG: DUF3310 domain-containing protein [Porphyromonadaceae bacterium]|nr:DUF3310 domain-containing protein [Porphyromonadaceae bacterium]
MSDYDVHGYAELDDAIRDGAGMRDSIRILGSVPVPRSTPYLPYRVERGGVLIIASSSESSVRMAGGVLRIVYDRHLDLTLYGTDIPGWRVELVDFPGGDADSVARTGAPHGWEIVREGAGVDEAESPPHYLWIGREIADRTGITHVTDLQAWDVLDAIAPDDPHVWNALKYLTRLGRKGDSSRRIVDLRKAAAYLERAIEEEERHGSE